MFHDFIYREDKKGKIIESNKGRKLTAEARFFHAVARDGVIEAVEMATFPDLVAVQWHPEITAAQDAGQQKLFEWLVIQAARQKYPAQHKA